MLPVVRSVMGLLPAAVASGPETIGKEPIWPAAEFAAGGTDGDAIARAEVERGVIPGCAAGRLVL